MAAGVKEVGACPRAGAAPRRGRSIRRAVARRASVALVVLAACSAAGGGPRAGELDAAVRAGESGERDDAAAPPTTRRHVLVTGFNDWKELGTPPNLWRCRDNPSCRLLVGDARDSRPDSLTGPLVVRLRDHQGTDWDFATLPVTWGAFETLDTGDYDVVVNLGLGVYDSVDRLQLEQGAYNARAGADAAGTTLAEPIDPASAERVRSAPTGTRVAERVAALAGRRFAGYEVSVASARAENTYLCNETHYRALTRLAASRAADGRLAEVYFLHIPFAANGDYEALADGVAGLLVALVE